MFCFEKRGDTEGEKESRQQARLQEVLIPHPIRPANAVRATRQSQGTGRAGLRDPM